MRQEKGHDQACSTESRCGRQEQQALHIMLVSDKSYGFRSSIRVRVRLDGKESFKTINGTSVCNNKTCILSLAKQYQKPRDFLSALDIGVSGESRLVDARTLDVLNPPSVVTPLSTTLITSFLEAK
ncbi:hypothetical protein EDC96DRAFT_460641 [Choanephora cucurbitarum]|nr:hypothetical protein EDC96DRAFT_460641 [Choanephora cucurbitarum]